MAVYSGQADGEAEQSFNMSYKVQISKWTVIMKSRTAWIETFYNAQRESTGSNTTSWIIGVWWDVIYRVQGPE